MMDKRINILSIVVLIIAGIQAQGGGGFRRMLFLRNRELALRRAFPFGTPMGFRGTRFPSSFAARVALERQRPFAFGTDPFMFSEFGRRQFAGNPLRTRFPTGFFEGQRFGTRSPFDTSSFGSTANAGFFPDRSGFPIRGGFGDGIPSPGSDFGRDLPPTGRDFGRDLPPTGRDFGRDLPPTESDFGRDISPTGRDFGRGLPEIGRDFDGGLPPSGRGLSASAGDGMRDQTGGSSTTSNSAGGMSGGDRAGSSGFQGVSDIPQIPRGGPNDLNRVDRGDSFQGSNNIGPGMNPRPDTLPGAGQFPSGPDMGGPFNGFNPRLPGQTPFGPDFGRTGSGPFPGDMTGDFRGDRRFDTRFPNGQFQGGLSGFGQGLDRNDRSRGFPQGQGDMTRDSRFLRQGPGPMDSSFQARSSFMNQFPRDSRLGSFGPFPRSAGPEFNTRESANDPNLNFRPLPGNQMQGQFGGPMDQNRFPMNPDMRNPNVNNNNFNNNNNNQILPMGNQAAQIDGFGAVSSTNNLNPDQNAFATSNTVTRSTNERPSDLFRFEEGASGSQPQIVSSDSNLPETGSNGFRVVEVGNILDTPVNTRRVTGLSTDQSVVDSMGFQSGGETNIASSQDVAGTTILTDGNQSNTNLDSTLSLPSPLNQDFSFFVPSDNTASDPQPQGATFNVPAPPPLPPIMVPNLNDQQPGAESTINEVNELLKSLDTMGLLTHHPKDLKQDLKPTTTTTESSFNMEASPKEPEVVKTTLNYPEKTKGPVSTTTVPLDVGNNLI